MPQLPINDIIVNNNDLIIGINSVLTSIESKIEVFNHRFPTPKMNIEELEVNCIQDNLHLQSILMALIKDKLHEIDDKLHVIMYADKNGSNAAK